MKAITLRQALIEANKINLNGADALVETSVLKQLIESCKARVSELEKTTKAMAKSALAEQGAKSGSFEHNGHHYTLDSTPVYDFVGKPKKYTMPEGVEYRKKAAEQQGYKDKSAAITRNLKSIRDSFPTAHPNIEPDGFTETLKCLD